MCVCLEGYKEREHAWVCICVRTCDHDRKIYKVHKCEAYAFFYIRDSNHSEQDTKRNN